MRFHFHTGPRELRALEPALKPCVHPTCCALQAAPGMRYCQPHNDRWLDLLAETNHDAGEGIECW